MLDTNVDTLPPGNGKVRSSKGESLGVVIVGGSSGESSTREEVTTQVKRSIKRMHSEKLS